MQTTRKLIEFFVQKVRVQNDTQYENHIISQLEKSV